MKERKNMWEIKQSVAQENVLELYIYGDVEGDSYDWWTDEIIRSETSANAFRDELAKYADVAEIKLYINSCGGSVFEGTAIYNQLKRHPAKKTVYIDGFAMSIASVIAMCGDEIIMPRNTMMVIHNAWMFTYGNAAELRKAADDLDKLNNVGKGAYLEKAGDKLNETTLSAMMDTETWLTAEECIRLGLADRFAEENADMANAASILQKKNLNVQQRIEIQKSLMMQLKQFTEPRIGEGDGDPKNADPQGKQNNEQKEEPVNIMQMLSGFFDTTKED